jgi:hypothetical protein
MNKYTVKPHAVDRALLRFGITSEHAENWFNQILLSANLVGEQGRQKVFEHKGKRIIVNGTEVVTIIKITDLPFAGKITKMVERELNKAKKALAKKEREISIEIAELTVEQATLSLNRLKAKSPAIKRTIAKKVEEISVRIDELSIALERDKDDFNHLQINASGYLISETKESQ